MAFPMPLPHFTGLLNLLPLSLVVWTGHMIVFHAVGLGFAWCDRTLGYQPRSENSFRPDREIQRGRNKK